MQTDNDVQPAMGAVHIVSAAAGYSDKHFMHDMHGDINEGHRILVERSRRGPFRQQKGRSTVLDSSAHVTYRNRAGVMEITVRRGAIAQEIKQLQNKLQMHRMSTWGTYVVLIKGTKRFRLGKLADLNLEYLKELVLECLQQYGTCGLELTEGMGQSGRGALYRDAVHAPKSKARIRRGKGLYKSAL